MVRVRVSGREGRAAVGAEGGAAGERVRRDGEGVASEPAPPDGRLSRHGRAAEQHGAGDAAEALVEGDVERVEEAAQLGEREAVVGRDLEEARAVGMQRHLARCAPLYQS